jgi:hypothetical protein
MVKGNVLIILSGTHNNSNKDRQLGVFRFVDRKITDFPHSRVRVA